MIPTHGTQVPAHAAARPVGGAGTLPLEVSALGRRFGAREALAGVDLRVEPGQIVGLVGPNGSGKTTMLKCLAGLIRPSSGTARLFGFDPWLEREAVLRRVRFAFAPAALFESLSAREHLRYVARLGVPRSRVSTEEIEDTLELVGLKERADERVASFSFGMRQRLGLALSLLPRPELLVLDEPTDGLDPLAVLELRAILARLRAEQGVAVLLSSHLLVEIDELVERMLVLRDGRSLFWGAPKELSQGGARLILSVDRCELACELLRARSLDPKRNGGDQIELPVDAIELSAAHALLQAGGVRLVAFHERRASLEEALLARLREDL